MGNKTERTVTGDGERSRSLILRGAALQRVRAWLPVHGVQ